MGEQPLLRVAGDRGKNRGLFGRRLRRAGVRVALASNGREALQRAPDRVLVDPGMPELDGHPASAAASADLATRALPVLVLCAQALDAARHFTLAPGQGCNDAGIEPMKVAARHCTLAPGHGCNDAGIEPMKVAARHCTLAPGQGCNDGEFKPMNGARPVDEIHRPPLPAAACNTLLQNPVPSVGITGTSTAHLRCNPSDDSAPAPDPAGAQDAPEGGGDR